MLLAGIPVLQIFLPKAQRKIPGLILPGIRFCSASSGDWAHLEFFGAISFFSAAQCSHRLLLPGICYACWEQLRVQKQVEGINIKELEESGICCRFGNDRPPWGS